MIHAYLVLGALACAVTYLATLAANAAGSVYFDKLLRHQYTNYRDTWECEGRSSGVFWSPSDARSESRGFRRTWYIEEKWLDARPEWVFKDLRATSLYNSLKFWRTVRRVFGGFAVGLPILVFFVAVVIGK